MRTSSLCPSASLWSPLLACWEPSRPQCVTGHLPQIARRLMVTWRPDPSLSPRSGSPLRAMRVNRVLVTETLGALSPERFLYLKSSELWVLPEAGCGPGRLTHGSSFCSMALSHVGAGDH